MTELLETVEIEPDGPAGMSVIWLHGLGADGHDFEPIVPELGLPDHLAPRFVFPHAPVRPVTINGGMAMRAWFDIISLGGDGPHDEEGFRQAVAQTEALIERERERGVPDERMVIAGFSQGGVVALYTALCHERRLTAFLGLSTFMPFGDALLDHRSNANADLPIFLGHGQYDSMVPIQAAESTRDQLRYAGYSVDWHSYPIDHGVSPDEIADVRKFLLGVVEGG